MSKLDDMLNMMGRPAPEAGDGGVDLGPCAARAKDRWVTALTVRHHARAWESFQYIGIGTRSTFTPEKFEVIFVGHEQKWRVTVTGRNLWEIYNNTIQHRLEWIRAAERDFGPDGEKVILSIDVVELKEGKA